MSRETYIRGFRKTAEAYGVNPDKLAKYAADATPASDLVLGTIGSAAGGLVPVVGPLAVQGAGLAGYFSDLESDESAKKQLPALIPGVGAYRITNRIRKQVLKELDDIKKDKANEGARPIRHAIAERFGPGTSTLGTTLAGAGLGAGLGLLSGGRLAEGATAGALTGAGAAVAANVAAAIAAAIKRRRTAKEQMESDKKSALVKYLFPGIATYDSWKRLGRSQGDREETEESKKKKGSDK